MADKARMALAVARKPRAPLQRPSASEKIFFR